MQRFWFFLFLLIYFVIIILPNTTTAQSEGDTVQYTMADTVLANKLYKEARLLFEKRKYEDALIKLDSAGKIFSFSVGKESVLYGKFLHTKGFVLLNTNNLDSAIIFSKMAIDTRIQVLGEYEADVANSYNNLSIAYNKKREYNDALKYAFKGLEIRLKLYGAEHLDLATSYNNIGSIYMDNGEYEKAIDYLEKALEIRLKLLGSENEVVGKSYNNLGNAHQNIGNYKIAIDYFFNSLTIFSKIFGEEHLSLVYPFNNLASIYSANGEYDKAIIYLEKSLDIVLKNYGKNHPNVPMLYRNLSALYSSKGEYDRSVESAKISLDICLELFGPENPNTAISYERLGGAFENKEEYEKAILYKNKALDILLKVLGDEHIDVGHLYFDLGSIYRNIGDYDKSIIFSNKALNILSKKLGFNHEDIAVCYSGLASSYRSKSLFDKSINYDLNALKILSEIFGNQHPDIATLYNNMGITYKMMNEYEKSEDYNKRALEIREKTLGNKHPFLTSSYNNLADLYNSKMEFDKAIEFYSKALFSNNYDEKFQFNTVLDISELFRSLEGGSNLNLMKYKLSRNQEFLFKSKALLDEAVSLLEYQFKNLSTNAKVSFSEESVHVINGILKTNKIFYSINSNVDYLTENFLYNERSKAYLLYSSMQENNALQIAGIPNDILQKEYNLRMGITHYDKKRQEKLSSGLNETDTIILTISSKLLDLNNQLDSLKNRLEVDFPDYYRAKYDLSTVSVEYVQDSLLQPNQSLIEYFVGDSSIFIFLVQPEHYEVVQVDKEPEFEQWVEDMTRNGIYGYYALKPEDRDDVLKDKSLRNYSESAHCLYEKLIAPVKAKLKKDKLIIIPDGVLGYVPFEALLTERPVRYDAIGRYKYLLEEHQISYCYSATLLREMRNRKHKQEPSQELLAMAPFFLGDVEQLVSYVDTSDVLIASLNPTRDSLDALPNSGEEVAKITSLWDGTPKYAKDATMELFQKTAGEYRILHLSTHGEADDRVGDYAYLAFGMPAANGTFEKLYARDLYNLSLNADMVVLSACETGIGKLQRGEGIISLARAFAYAGAKSIVTTLWKVKDQQTKDLAVSFYKYLHNRKSKDEALQLAKREFLEKNKKNTELLHPYFWAGFIGIGDMSAIR